MTKDEALDLALEALENSIVSPAMFATWGKYQEAREHKEKAITAIKQARSAPAFFDWYDNAHWGNEDFKEGCHRSWNAAIKYTTPPAAQPAPDCKETGVCVKTGLACFGQAAQPAVPMTDQQIDDEHDKLFPPTIIPGARARVREFARAIEAKLKEKNT